MQFLKSIPLTFYSRDFYVNLIRRGCGIGFCFMLLQAFLMLAIPVIQIVPELPTIREKVATIAQEIPEITIKDQKLSIDKPSPYTIDLMPDSKEPHNIILFDTSSDLTNIATVGQMMEDKHIAALFTPDYFAVSQGGSVGSSIKIYTMRDLGSANNNIKITHEQWNALGQKLLAWAGPIGLLFMAVGLMISILIITFFKGLILLVVGIFTSLSPSLATTMRLSAAASVPGSILLAALSLVHVPLLRYTELALWSILSIYGLVVANKAAKTEAQTIH